MAKFYSFSPNPNTRVYAPTILNKNEVFSYCKNCGTDFLVKRDSNIDLLIEGQGKFPEILLCGHWPLTILSERVITKWKEKGITG